jgi:hypothetical protein
MKRTSAQPWIWKPAIAAALIALGTLITLTQFKYFDVHMSHFQLFLDQGGLWCLTDSNSYWDLKLVNYLTPHSFSASFPLPELGAFWFAIPWWTLCLGCIGFAWLIWRRKSRSRINQVPTPSGFEPLVPSKK